MTPPDKADETIGPVCLNHGKICANTKRVLEDNVKQWELLGMLQDKQAGKRLVWAIVGIFVTAGIALGGYFAGRLDNVNAAIPRVVEQTEARLVGAIQEGKRDRNKALETIGNQLESHNRSLAQIQVNQASLGTKVERIEKVVDRLVIH